MEMVEDPIGETMAKSRGGRSSDLPLDVAALMADEGAGIRSDAATASTSGGTPARTRATVRPVAR